MNPTISVIMGAYNCARTLPEAIAAIQHQTVSDWEFIICDDGSSDETWQVASEFQRNDERIVLLRNEKNLGLNATLNKCLAAASGYYIARMDGDDVCTPDRFEKELALYAEHPEAGVISCSMSFFDDEGIFGKMIYDAAPQPRIFCMVLSFAMQGHLCAEIFWRSWADILKTKIRCVLKTTIFGFGCTLPVTAALIRKKYCITCEMTAMRFRAGHFKAGSTRVRSF